MTEYIERKALLELINEDCKYKNPTNEYTRGCNEVCDWAIKTIRNMPTADVVPKSEADNLIKVIDNTTQQFLELHDLYQNTKSELSGKYEDLKLKYADLQKDHAELIAWGGHIKSTERTEIEKAIAREIFAEIERAIEDAELEWGTILGVKLCIAELKKKYGELK